jgi:hypothetical protein
LLLRDLAKALPAKTSPEQKKIIENAVKQVSQIAVDLDNSGDAGDQARTEANLQCGTRHSRTTRKTVTEAVVV